MGRIEKPGHLEPKSYVLLHFDHVIGVINATTFEELKSKLNTAIIENINVDNDSAPISITFIDPIGDYGDTTQIEASYVNDGELVSDQEFSIMRTCIY